MPCQATTNMSAQLGVCKNVKSKCEKQPVFLTYDAHYRPDLSGRSSKDQVTSLKTFKRTQETVDLSITQSQ